jgi:hypothetical protein
MDNTTLTLIVVASLVAVVIIIAVLGWKSAQFRIDIKGPAGMKVNLVSSNQPPPSAPAVAVEDATSHGGEIRVNDGTGRGAVVKRVDAQGNIIATSAPPPQDNGSKKR